MPFRSRHDKHGDHARKNESNTTKRGLQVAIGIALAVLALGVGVGIPFGLLNNGQNAASTRAAIDGEQGLDAHDSARLGADDDVQAAAELASGQGVIDTKLEQMLGESLDDFAQVDLSNAEYAAGQLLVVFDATTSVAQAQASLEAIGAWTDDELSNEMLFNETPLTINLPQEYSVAQTLVALGDDPQITYAQPDYTYTLIDDLDATYYNEEDLEAIAQATYAAPAASTASDAQAGEANVNDDSNELDFAINDPLADSEHSFFQYYLDTIGAFEAWNTVRCNGRVKVAVIDTGVHYTHVDLVGTNTTIIDLAQAYDVTKHKQQAIDTYGHGTHVAGIIASEANNAIGAAGVSYNAQIVPVKVFEDGMGSTTTSNIVGGFTYAVGLDDVRVINMSLGGPAYDEGNDALMHAALVDAQNKGIIVICSAGNDATSALQYPSDYDECVSVIATDRNDRIASFSNYGMTKDIAAPGVDITSTYIDVAGYAPNKVFAMMSGTSMASPVVAGVAALVIAKDPSLSVAEVKNVLYNTATDLGASGFDKYYAHGRVDAALAVKQDAQIQIVAPADSVAQTTTLQFSIEGDDVSAYTWSVATVGEEGGSAAITQEGLLTGYDAGPVRVRATLNADEAHYAEKNITVAGIALGQAPAVEAHTSTSLKITWEQPNGAMGYYLYRTTDPDYGIVQKIAKITDGALTNYVDEGLDCGETFYYAVQPFGSFNGRELIGTRSAFSGAVVYPAHPKGLAAARDTATTLTLSWEAVDEATGYYLYRALAPSVSNPEPVYELVADCPAGTMSYTDSNLTEGTWYFYCVSSYVLINYEVVESAASDSITAAPHGEDWVDRARAPLGFRESVDEATTSSITYLWDAEDGASGYLIGVKPYGAQEPTMNIKVESGSTTTYTLEGLEPNSTYETTIRSYTTVGGQDYVSSDAASLDAVTLALAPTNLQATLMSDSDVGFHLTWDVSSGDRKCVPQVEQAGLPYSEQDIILYDGNWLAIPMSFQGSLNNITTQLSSTYPTLTYYPSRLRVRLTATIKGVDRSGLALDLSEAESTIYGPYSEPIHVAGRLVTPTITSLIADKGTVTLKFMATPRNAVFHIERASIEDGTYEEIDTIENPYYADGLGQTGELSYTDNPTELDATYWYRIVGSSEVDGETLTSEPSSASSIFVRRIRTEAALTSVSMMGCTGVIDEAAHTVTVTLPYGTPRTAAQSLAPAIEVSSGASVEPASGVVQNFENPVSYVVTAEAGNRVEWTVRVAFLANTWTPLEGTGRYDTMQAVIQEGFASDSRDTVVLASGANFPDALAASGFAGIYGAPILLTDPASLSKQAAQEIVRLGASTVYLVGGTGALSSTVELQVKDLAGVMSVTRRWGESRSATACDMLLSGGNAWDDTLIIVNGYSFADALSIAPYAYASCSPLVLTDAGGVLDEYTLEQALAFDPANVLLVGGAGVVNDQVMTQLGERNYVRLGGEDRYRTSARVALWCTGGSTGDTFAPALELGFDDVAVATGSNFPDALAGSALCGSRGSVLLLADDSSTGRYNVLYTIPNNKETIARGYFLGGEGVITPVLRQSIRDACALDDR